WPGASPILRLHAELLQPVTHGVWAPLKFSRHLCQRGPRLDERLKLFARQSSARRMRTSSIGHQSVLLNPVADSGRIAIDEDSDLGKREPLVQPVLELILIHERILPVASDGKANVCSL